MIPKISICIPTFNRSDLLEQALKSVSLQTVKPFEWIVVDNASTDNTREVVQKYKKFGVKFYRNRKNVGMANNWNVCIQKSKGDYLAFLHNDDVIAPNWYEEMLLAVKAHPNVRFFMSSLLIIDEKNTVLQEYHTFNSSRFIKKTQAINQFWTHLLPGFAPIATNLYHKSVFKKVGFYDDRWGTEADVLNSYDILSNFDVWYLDKVIFAYRVHAKQGIDLIDQKKTLDEELRRKRNHYSIIKQCYEMYFHQSDNCRFFVQYPVMMTLVPISFHLIWGNWKKVFSHFKLAQQEFPDLFHYFSDWMIFLKVFVVFLKRVTLDKLFLITKRHQYDWLTAE